MRKMVIWIILGLTMFIGCSRYMSYQRHSSSDIPFDKHRPSPVDKPIIISTKGPQLSPEHYEIMGKVNSKIDNPIILEKKCKDAVEMLRYEAQVVGADALINVSCSWDKNSEMASGIAITFKSREETLRVLKNINAILE
jgi:hypothetical protein